MLKISKLKASFRDPSGNVFFKKNKIFRSIKHVAREDYKYFMKSGLYQKLSSLNLLISHKEVKNFNKEAYHKVLCPEKIPFITYPYEWSFGQLKDAALLTIRVQEIALGYGMSLKDASSYNIQFLKGKPIFIDTLSFERYKKDTPWIAYRQFCEHFLSPLSMMSYKDNRFSKFMSIFMDGIPLDFTASILPKILLFKPALFFHVFLHSKIKSLSLRKTIGLEKMGKLSLKNQLLLLNNMGEYITKTDYKNFNGEWSEYYDKLGYKNSSFDCKKRLVRNFIKIASPKTVWDAGANDGLFSRLISKDVDLVVSTDNDPQVVNNNYSLNKTRNIKNVLPLVIDIANPSPAIGWENSERDSFLQRANFDCIMALALIHHLITKNNVSFRMLSDFFSRITKFLIVEFIGENDERFKDLVLKTKNRSYSYSKEKFEREFLKKFYLVKKSNIEGSDRDLYLFKKK